MEVFAETSECRGHGVHLKGVTGAGGANEEDLEIGGRNTPEAVPSLV